MDRNIARNPQRFIPLTVNEHIIMDNFQVRKLTTLGDWYNLAGTSNTSNFIYPDGVIGDYYKTMDLFHYKGEIVNREIYLSLLMLLNRDLLNVKKYDTKLFKYFRRNLTKANNKNKYNGMRFELSTASILAQKSIRFKKSETPDFLINGDKLGIECTSARVSNSNTKGDLSYKVITSLHKKNNKKYKSHENILFIDVTNLSHIESRNIGSNTFDKYRNKIKQEIDKSIFESIILYVFLFESDKFRLHQAYSRFDRTQVSKKSKRFLNEHWQMGNITFFNYGIPEEG